MTKCKRGPNKLIVNCESELFQGLTKSLIDIPMTSSADNFSDPSQKEIAAAVGYVIGFLLGKLAHFVAKNTIILKSLLLPCFL